MSDVPGINVGDRGAVTAVVRPEMTAAALGSGSVEGLGTPALVALCEGAAVAALRDRLPVDASSVGTRVDIRHLAPTAVGMSVTAVAEVTEVDGRRVVFSVSAKDEAGLIGEGTHERFLIDLATFAARVRTRCPGSE